MLNAMEQSRDPLPGPLTRFSNLELSKKAASSILGFPPQMRYPAMPNNEERIRVLTQLIANEKDPEKVKVLAVELGRLLTIERRPLPIAKDKPRSS